MNSEEPPLSITRYLVRFYSGTNLEMKQQFNFNEPDFFVSIRENPEYNPDDSDYPSQLILDVIIHADNIENAISNAKQAAETVLGMISCSVSCFADLCKFDRAIDYSEGTCDRIFVQDTYGTYNVSAKRELNAEIYSIFHEKLTTARKNFSGDTINVISRAFRWYRKGLIEQELFDRYINFWTGLECIKKELDLKYCEGKSQLIRECPKCGYKYKIPSSEGIKYLLREKLNYPEEIWKELRETRTAIIHGYGQLNYISPKANRLLPYLQKALLYGLLDLLEFTDEEKQNFLKNPYYYAGKQIFRYSCILKNVDFLQINIEKLPQFVITNPLFSQSGDDKQIVQTQKSTLFLDNFKGQCSDLSAEWFMETDPDKTDKIKMEISIDFAEK